MPEPRLRAESDRYRSYLHSSETSSHLPTLVAILERHGLSWAICDYVPVHDAAWARLEGWLSDAIAHWQPQSLAVSSSFCWGGVGTFLKRLAARHPDLPCLLGGSLMYLHLDDLAADWPPNLAGVCDGDGEEALPAAVQALREGKTLGGIAGLLVPSPRGPMRNGEATIVDLDDIPLPSAQFVAEFQETYYLESMRGCPFQCAFCHFPSLSPGFRVKSACKVFEEFRFAADSGARTVAHGRWLAPTRPSRRRRRAFGPFWRRWLRRGSPFAGIASCAPSASTARSAP
jgi:radical SAM superfamily enzyme YgiQ (UPF0313 family)